MVIVDISKLTRSDSEKLSAGPKDLSGSNVTSVYAMNNMIHSRLISNQSKVTKPSITLLGTSTPAKLQGNISMLPSPISTDLKVFATADLMSPSPEMTPSELANTTGDIVGLKNASNEGSTYTICFDVKKTTTCVLKLYNFYTMF